MARVIINSKEYEWGNIQVVVAGRPVVGLRGIDYKTTREKEMVYGAGDEPHGIQYGNKKYEGTLTILQSELEALGRFAKENGFEDITEFEFDIVVAYVPRTGVPIVTDVVKFASITEIPKGMKQNDKYMEISLPYVALGIEYNK